MKKNLKKVISAVIALALSATSIATVSFAKGYTDVASTASYAEAVDVLSSLGIIEGNGDGTFGPDKSIKRSEAAKMIVGMINKIAVGEARKGQTQFNDVAADHWASGFINVGVTEKFINGITATTFKPDGEVTYNQMVKMIVACLGYEEYAQFYGGYPSGYVAVADSEGVTKGCSMDGNAPATRAVAAQLIFNALKTPIVLPKGMTYSAVAGGFVPNIERQDAEDSAYFKTLLTEKFDAYYLEGAVIATSKQSTKPGEVNFDIMDKEYYDNDVIASGSLNGIAVGDTDAENYLHTYASVIAQEDEDGLWTLLSFQPSGKNNVVTLDAALFDTDEYDAAKVYTSGAINDGAKVYYYANEDASRSTAYKLDKDAKLYVNGVAITDRTNSTSGLQDELETYVFANDLVGKVELIDIYKKTTSNNVTTTQVTDDEYDIISVESYVTAKVDSVTSNKIIFSDVKGASATSITLDEEDNEDLVYHIYYNDEEIAISDIKADDILSIAYDVSKTIKTSNFYDIYVSREAPEGKYNGIDDTDETVTIGGEVYTFIDGFATGKNSVSLGNEYKLYVDVFGRIFKAEMITSTAKIAIVDKIDDDRNGEPAVSLYFADGTSKWVEIKSYGDIGSWGQLETAYLKGGYGSDKDDKKPIENRVVEYKINSEGYITSLKFINAAASASSKTEYNERTNAIGSVRMTSATKIIDAISYADKYVNSYPDAKISELAISSLDALVNGVEYIAYAYGDRDSNNAYPFVIITEGESVYTKDTILAVATKALGYSTDADGDEIFTLTALYNDGTDAGKTEAQVLEVSYDAKVGATAITESNYAGLVKKGDLLVFQVDGKNQISQIDIIMTGLLGDTETDYTNKTVNGTFTAISTDEDTYGLFTLPAEADKWTKSWKRSTYTSDYSNLVYGIITDKGDSFFDLAQVEKVTSAIVDDKGDKDTSNDVTLVAANSLITKLTNTDITAADTAKDFEGKVLNVGLSDATRVYVYDYNESKSDMLRVGVKADIAKTMISDVYKEIVNNDDIVNWSKQFDGKAVKDTLTINFAFAKIDNGVATDVYVIKGVDNRK